MNNFHLILIPLLLLTSSCNDYSNADNRVIESDSVKSVSSPAPHDTAAINVIDTLPHALNTKGVTADSIISFARTLLGTPYRYGSTDPAVGFDCSGFITYVFNHFKIEVPRSSIDFDHSGQPIPLPQVKKGDLILFTGTDSTERFIGHIGIIVSNDSGKVQFIHSSSGKAYGVVITPLDSYYMGRYMKTIRILNK